MPKLGLTELKHFLAVVAVMAGLPLVHIVGVTPEAPTLEAALQGHTPEAEFTVGKKEIEEARKISSTTASNKVDYILMGCPHLTMKEIKTVADILRGKKVAAGVKLIAVTTKELYEQAKDLGYVDDIVNAGGQITVQMCIAFAGTQVRDAAVLTNSAKAGYWYSGFGADEKHRTVRLLSTRICAESAVAGKVVE
jgi:predicted aconitase